MLHQAMSWIISQSSPTMSVCYSSVIRVDDIHLHSFQWYFQILEPPLHEKQLFQERSNHQLNYVNYFSHGWWTNNDLNSENWPMIKKRTWIFKFHMAGHKCFPHISSKVVFMTSQNCWKNSLRGFFCLYNVSAN